MTISEIDSKITFLTGADSNSFPQADRLISVNNWYEIVQSTIFNSQDESDFDDSNYTDYPIYKRNLVADQQDYRFDTASWGAVGLEGAADSTDVAIKPLTISRVELLFKTGGSWKKAEAFDIGERGKATDTNSLSDFSESNPLYDIRNNALWIYPIPSNNVTDGLKIWVSRIIDKFTSAQYTTGTKEPGFDELYHDILAFGPSYDFGIANGLNNVQLLKLELNERLAKLAVHYSNKQKDRKYRISPSFINYK